MSVAETLMILFAFGGFIIALIELIIEICKLTKK